MSHRALLLAVPFVLSACVGSGPRTQAVFENEGATVLRSAQNTPFVVVGVNEGVADQASHWLARTTTRAFVRDTGSGPVVIGAGDILDISIISTPSENGGFLDLANSSFAPISTTDLPQQEVGTDGMVNAPPVGRISAMGLSAQALENELEQRLGEVLVEPSVIVRIAERRSARVSVLGDVAEPGTYTIDQTNMRLVEMIALAGGPEEARAEDLEVSFSRNGVTGRAALDEVYRNPRYNIKVRPGDVISVDAPARRLTILGAGETNQTLVFNEPDLTLADALGRAGGLQNRRADRQGVFVYREVPTEQVAALGVDTTGFSGASVPVIFNFDLSQPQSLFATRDFAMGEGDLVYIADSANEEIASVFAVFNYFLPTPAQLVLLELND